MKKIFCFLIFSSFYFLFTNRAFATGCDIFYYSPRPLLATSPEANFTLGRTEPGKNYTIEIDCKGWPPTVRIEHIVASEVTISAIVQKSQHSCVFSSGIHNISLWEEGKTKAACTSQYEVISGCQLAINDTSPDTNTDITISGTNVSSQTNLLCILDPINTYSNYSIRVAADNTFSQTFKIASKGDYVAKVGLGVKCDQLISSFGCQGLPFSVRMPGAPTLPPVPGGGGIKPTECDSNNDGENDGIETALGCIPTKDPTRFVAWLLGFAIGIGGGIAMLLIIFGAFQVMTSSGNPENLKKGQEKITSAIAGLIFIIFSVFLLKLIGVNILNIPGFGTP